jgi:hypothetical protein
MFRDIMLGDTTADRVARGAALLDEYRPGWASEIHLHELSIESDSNCVLGQLYGNYGLGREQLRILTTTHSEALGFTGGYAGGDWSGLRRAWRELIEDRCNRVSPDQLQLVG